ncbi:hypothetical protein EIP91_006656 [Steccherinum ochraceum]|uniref:BTB domain-containing protein n=1 Tax=Steccherinum ochraceum TaxID=92696 RepID=A0A4R0R5H8_9APHY|nr:hypothetical protein EIP91_006656 [Steccherinum ochraceum]
MSDSPTPTPPIVVIPAGAPFDREDADVVLQSCDGVQFLVHRLVLSLSSPVLAALFEIGTSNHPEDQFTPTGLLVVPVEETGRVLSSLLYWVYPVTKPPLEAIEEVADALEAAIKYQIGAVVDFMTVRLRAFAVTLPLRVFGIACRLDLEEEAKFAAQKYRADARRRTPNHYHSDMASIPAGAYFRLSWYSTHGPIVPPPSFNFIHRNRNDGIALSESTEDVIEGNAFLSSEKWNQDTQSIFENNPFDLVICSSEAGRFIAHRLVVSVMSSALGTEIGKLAEGNPILNLSESSFIIYSLLRSYYGFPLFAEFPASQPDDFCPLIRVVQAARKYGMARIESQALALLKEVMQAKPVRAYCVAIALGWRTEATSAARAVIASKVNLAEAYVAEMEHVPAVAFYTLLTSSDNVAAKVKQITSRFGANRMLLSNRYPATVGPEQTVMVAGMGKWFHAENLASETQEMEAALRRVILEVSLPEP